jgi:glycosyltransferase involved in cell wall biosynthesis
VNKVLNVVTQLEAGGAQVLAADVRAALEEPDWSSDLLFLYLKTPALGFDVKSCIMPGRPTGWSSLLSMLTKLRKHMRQYRVVVAHTHFSILACGFLRLVLPRSVKLIAVHHGPLEQYPSGIAFACRLLARFGAYSLEIAVSEGVLAELTRQRSYSKPERFRLILNGVRLMDMVPGCNTPPRVVGVGRLAREKNQLTIVNAAGLTMSPFVLIGEGPERQKLEDAASNRVDPSFTFLGTIPREQVLRELRESDIFVSASTWEAMPISALEAAAASCALVLSDIPAHRNMFGDVAHYFPADDAAELAAQINALALAPDALISAKRRAWEHARLFGLEKTLAAYAESVKRVM